MARHGVRGSQPERRPDGAGVMVGRRDGRGHRTRHPNRGQHCRQRTHDAHPDYPLHDHRDKSRINPNTNNWRRAGVSLGVRLDLLKGGRDVTKFGVLGPVLADPHGTGRAVPLPAKQRIVLACLLLSANRVVSLDRLIQALWDEPPRTARITTQGYVKDLRNMLGADGRSRIVTAGGGYRFIAHEGELDLHGFGKLRDAGAADVRAGDWAAAAEKLRTALALWRGEPLLDVPSILLQREEVPALTETWLQATELRVAADLALGRHQELTVELRALTAAHPLREKFHEQLMLALYRSGMHAEAIDAYRRVRRLLAAELGIEPGPELRDLHQRMLTDDPGLVSASAPDQGAAFGPPRQLPAAITGFTGRSAQVKRLLEVLDRSADANPHSLIISVITGAGGVGKTSLAVHAAHQLATHFPDGQLYVDMRGSGDAAKDPAEMLAEFLRDLGVPDTSIPAGVDARAARYRTILAGRKVLVMLDNARDSAQVKPLLPGSASCHVLITSRNRMSGLAGSRLDLDVLLPDEAHALFASIVGSRVEAEPEATSAVLAHCGGLPLAIRIAGARLAGRPAWSVQALARRLDDRRRVLDELRTDDLAVQASLDVSYNSMRRSAAGIDPARAFQFLGLFPGPSVPLPAMSALMGVAPAQAEPELEYLVDCSLLESRAPGRYQMHDLLHAYATECAERELSPSDRHDGVSRLTHWYLSAMVTADKMLWPHLQRPEAPPPDPKHPAPHFLDLGQALQWFDQERPSLTGIAALAESHRLDAFAGLIAVFTAGYYLRRCHWSDWLATNEIGLRATRRLNDQALEARLLISRGIVLGSTHTLGEAEECFTAALKIWENLGDLAGCATANVNLGTLLKREGKYREAVTCLTNALALARSSGALPTEGAALGNLGTCQDRLGNYAQALSYQHACLAIWRQIGNQDGTCTALMNIGEVYLHSNRPADALVHLRQALEIAESTHGRHEEAMVLTNLGHAMIALDRTSEAHHYLQKALSIWQALGDPQADAVR